MQTEHTNGYHLETERRLTKLETKMNVLIGLIGLHMGVSSWPLLKPLVLSVASAFGVQ